MTITLSLTLILNKVDKNFHRVTTTVNDRISPHSRITPLPNKPPPPKPILTNKPPLPNKPPWGLFRIHSGCFSFFSCNLSNEMVDAAPLETIVDEDKEGDSDIEID